jgi:hypothetical protein
LLDSKKTLLLLYLLEMWISKKRQVLYFTHFSENRVPLKDKRALKGALDAPWQGGQKKGDILLGEADYIRSHNVTFATQCNPRE